MRNKTFCLIATLVWLLSMTGSFQSCHAQIPKWRAGVSLNTGMGRVLFWGIFPRYQSNFYPMGVTVNFAGLAERAFSNQFVLQSGIELRWAHLNHLGVDEPFPGYYYHRISYRTLRLGVPLQLRYYFGNKANRLFIQGGTAVDYLCFSGAKVSEAYGSQDYTTVQEFTLQPAFNQGNVGIDLSLSPGMEFTLKEEKVFRAGLNLGTKLNITPTLDYASFFCGFYLSWLTAS